MNLPPMNRRQLLQSGVYGLAALGLETSRGEAAVAQINEEQLVKDVAGKYCCDVFLNNEEKERAADAAKRENLVVAAPAIPRDEGGRPYASFNHNNEVNYAMSEQFAGAIWAKKWETGKTLNVKFLDGIPAVKDKVKSYAKSLEKIVNLTFNFDDTLANAKTHIRISFEREGYWSYLGKDALGRPTNEPTMNYDKNHLRMNSPDTEYQRVVLHEFGHAIGLVHEHQHPESKIPWDEPKVQAYYKRTQGWDISDVVRNIFTVYAASLLQFGIYDPSSIMHYPIPLELLKAGSANRVVGWNTDLSPIDRVVLAWQYPKK